MPRNFNSQLSCQIGESLVVSELGRHGIIATAFSGNVPDIDLLGYKEDGITLALQVKAWKDGSLSFNVTRWLKVKLDGNRQIIKGIIDGLNEDLIYVFVKLGKKAGQDRFFILSGKNLAEILLKKHGAFLKKHNSIRPRNPKSMHCSLTEKHLNTYRDNWEIITK